MIFKWITLVIPGLIHAILKDSPNLFFFKKMGSIYMSNPLFLKKKKDKNQILIEVILLLIK